MDCRKAQQNIDLYIDGMLESVLTQQLERHIASCTHCQETLDDTLRLKRALRELGDLEPPANLAHSAFKKARRRPLFTYLTAASGLAAAAVVIAAVLLTGGPDANRAPEMGASMLAADSSEPYATQMMPMDDAETDYNIAEQAPYLFGAGEDGSLRIFENEYEFAAEFGRGYYRPVSLPEGSALESITEDGYAVVFKYRLGSGGIFEFGWIISALDEERSAEYQSKAVSDEQLSNSIQYEQDGQLFWVSTTDDILDINAYREAQWQP